MKKLLTLILLWCGVNAMGEFLIKFGTRSLMDPQTPQEILPWIWEVIRNPLIMLGVVFCALDLLILIFILKNGDLGVVVPLTSLSYILALAVGCIMFHEVLTIPKVVGIVLICGGTYILSR